MKLNFTLLLVLAITANLLAQSNYDANIFHPFSGKFTLSVDGGITYSRTDFKNDGIDYLTRLSLDYYFPTLSIGTVGMKIFGGTGYLRGDGIPSSNPVFNNTENFRSLIYYLGGGASFNIAASESVIPYLFGGVSYLYCDPKDKDGNNLVPVGNAFSRHEIMLVGEAGIKFLFADNFGMNLAAGVDYVDSDKLDGFRFGNEKDIFFHVLGGFTYYFGGVIDTDVDGIRDQNDQCPDTPPFVKVDEFGCPIDSDKDGVPDYMDNCPETPRNVIVDQNGCPLDVDEDGVPDYLDLCPATPDGVKVDSRGCPADSDEDGVPDYKDLCPNTPVGTEVNKWGCPIEEIVIETPVPEKIEFILSGGVTFEINKADLLPPAFIDLDKVLKVMKDRPETKWKIEGHTDNTGSYTRNKELSLQRAQSVYNYFIRNGIAAARLQVNGYGSDYPIADNITETGKAMNRRVSITLLSQDNSDKTNGNNNQINIDTKGVYDPALEKQIGNMVFTDGNLYCFQVSSWRTREKAESEMNQLVTTGIKSFVVTANAPNLDGTWYRVRVGYFNSLEELNIVKAKVSK